MATFFLSLNASVPTRIQWFLKFYFQGFPGSCRSPYCPNTSLVSPGPTPNFNLPILPISLCLSPGKLSELSLVQTPHLCLQDLLPTSACRDTLNVHLQASCRSFHCPNTSLVSPGPTPNLSLSRYSQCSSPGKLSEFSLSKHLTCVSRTYSQPQPVEIFSIISKKCRFRQSIDKSPSSNDLTANMPKMK